ncbi:hypothetical protein V8C42DRAFT_362574 [Trichoderma barbatum]
MGTSSSKTSYEQPRTEVEIALYIRAQEVRRYFSIEDQADKTISTGYTAFIGPVSHLDNGSIKSLRLTCRLFGTIELRISRVFLSANPLNIQVFRSIADHDVYRQGITEIIYDDARLYRSFSDWASDVHPDVYRWCDIPTELDWFLTQGNESLSDLTARRSSVDLDRPENIGRTRQANAGLSPEDSWTYCQDLLSQQDQVIASGADAEALRYGLRQFPALQRVSVTPAAHGWLFTPLYETPMIRAFPYGFIYPIPRGWPTRRGGKVSVFAESWEDTKEKWRGFSIVAEALAQEQHHVAEFLIDSHYLHAGLNCCLFEQPNKVYGFFQSILQQPSLEKLYLSLYVDGQQQNNPGWPAFRGSLLRNALAGASQLEHFSMDTSWDENYPINEAPPPALRTFLPLDCWTGLRHFRLWNFPVYRDDLISALSQLLGLRFLELGFLTIYPGSDRELLIDMRDSLRWHERLAPPKVKYAVPATSCNIQGRAIWLDEDVEKFLYHNGRNPFDSTYGEACVRMGIIKDAFDPGFERPH